MTISPFAAREGTSAPEWPNVKKCCRHLVPSSDYFVQSYAVPRLPGAYPLIQNDYRQEKIIFELFSGALQENPVSAPGAITGGAPTGQGPIQETIFWELSSGALQENPVIAPGQLHEKMFTELFW